MWYIIIAENEPWFKSVQCCFMTELGSFAFRQNQLLMQVLKSCCLCMSLLTQTSESKTTRQSQVTRTLKSLKSLVKPFTTLSSSPDFSSIFLLLSSDSCTNKQEKQKPKIHILTTALSFEALVVKASNFSFMSESCKPAATTCTNQTNDKSLKMHSVQSFSEYFFQVALYCLAITWQSHGNAISCLSHHSSPMPQAFWQRGSRRPAETMAISANFIDSSETRNTDTTTLSMQQTNTKTFYQFNSEYILLIPLVISNAPLKKTFKDQSVRPGRPGPFSIDHCDPCVLRNP